MKRLRFAYPNQKIGMFVTGEYGDGSKRPLWQEPGKTSKGELVLYRPHWHALVFNWRPRDLVYKYTNERGDEVFSSGVLDVLWGKGTSDVGSVTFESAGYCARYATKKLVFGKDQQHDLHPISKKSSKQAIGKSWLEKNWSDILHGYVTIKSKDRYVDVSVPRYYEKWLKENKPDDWIYYLEQKLKKAAVAVQKEEVEKFKIAEINYQRGSFKGGQTTKFEHRRRILKEKFERLTKYLKGDI